MRRRGRIIGVVLSVPEEVSLLANRIRREYDPNFTRIGPHVTVLPPREVFQTRRRVRASVARVAKATRPIRIVLGRIRTFSPVMPVVFASLKRGVAPLGKLHRRLASGVLRGHEAFPYVPHLTLGQSLDPARLRRALAFSRRLFEERPEKRWSADHLIVVERVSEEVWIPHSPFPLDGARTGIAPAVSRTTSAARRRKTGKARR
jgi:2'-5' RNA ligase